MDNFTINTPEKAKTRADTKEKGHVIWFSATLLHAFSEIDLQLATALVGVAKSNSETVRL